MALVACPTSSIGTSPKADASDGRARLSRADPRQRRLLRIHVGALLRRLELPDRAAGHSAGNVLVDSPRAAGPLLTALEERGGVATMFLTHRDDVADHAAFRKRFGCERVLHERRRDRRHPRRGAADRRRSSPSRLADDLLAIPTPGHTRGHAVLLYRDRYLFTGDHLAWSRRRGHLVAFRDANWYSWPETIRSMERLLDYSFEWVLPGHGDRHRAESPAAMRRELETCIAWMKQR